MLYPCPACGFEVFGQPAGSYDICPLCDWEDDEVQLRFPALRIGANQESLAAWQAQLMQKLPTHVTAYEGYWRCPDWRPLTPDDCSDARGMPTSGREYFDALDAEEPRYYWRTRSE